MNSASTKIFWQATISSIFLAIVTAFLNHIYWKTIYLPIGLFLAILGNSIIVLVLISSLPASASRLWGLFPLLVWTLVTLLIFAGGVGGDILIPSTTSNEINSFINQYFIFLTIFPVLLIFLFLIRKFS